MLRSWYVMVKFMLRTRLYLLLLLLFVCPVFATSSKELTNLSKVPWPRQVYRMAFDDLNQKKHKGKYYIVGESPKTGSFEATFELPKSINLVFKDDETKSQTEFSWAKDVPLKKVSGSTNVEDPLLKVFDTALGAMALSTMLESIYLWRDPAVSMSSFFTVRVNFIDQKHVMDLMPVLPILDDYLWRWVILPTKDKFKVAEWRIKGQNIEYLMEFEGEK